MSDESQRPRHRGQVALQASQGNQANRVIAVVLGSLGLVIAGAVLVVIAVFRFSQPTVPFAIGTLTYHWVDTSRADIFAVDPTTCRELMVVWYPADADPASIRAPYMQEADADIVAFARVHNKPSFLLNQFKYVTNAVTAARMPGTFHSNFMDIPN